MASPSDSPDRRNAILRKSAESRETQHTFFEREADHIDRCAVAMAKAFDDGRRLFVMGNGGSACDAEHAAVEFAHPIVEKRPALPVTSLSSSSAYLTAVGNDEDFALSFAKQIRLSAQSGDMLLGVSTSGKSRNVIRGLQAGQELGLLNVGFTGRDGGKMPSLCEHCFVVPSFSIHRIQEVHGVLLHVLWDLIHVVRGEEDVL